MAAHDVIDGTDVVKSSRIVGLQLDHTRERLYRLLVPTGGVVEGAERIVVVPVGGPQPDGGLVLLLRLVGPAQGLQHLPAQPMGIVAVRLQGQRLVQFLERHLAATCPMID